MGDRPQRLERLPQQYFVGLLARVAAAAAADGPPLVDLGRGQPGGRAAAARRRGARARPAAGPTVHGYAPIRGLRRLREAIAARYRDVYGVELDPEREVAVVPGTKTAIVELRAWHSPTRATRSSCPTRTTPTIRPGSRSPVRTLRTVPLDPARAGRPTSPTLRPRRPLYLNYPSNPCAVCAPPGTFDDAVAGRGARGRGRPRRGVHRPRLRRPPPARASSRRPARRTSASRCGRCRRPTAWPAGASASSSATRRSSSASTCSTTTRAWASSRRCRRPRSQRSKGRRTRSASASPTYERRRDALAAALPEPPVCEGHVLRLAPPARRV